MNVSRSNKRLGTLGKGVTLVALLGLASSAIAADTQSVPGNSQTPKLLEQGSQKYARFVDNDVKQLQHNVHRLKVAIDNGNLAEAKRLYPIARPGYELIESDVENFVLPGFKPSDNRGNLDYLIDMRSSNLDTKVGWHGFHAIERDLFQNGKITAHTRSLAQELMSNVNKLDMVVHHISYAPKDLAAGASDLLEEVQTSKITGEEEAFSHHDLVDFAANVEGAQQAFDDLKPGLQTIDPVLVKSVDLQFKRVNDMLDSYKDSKVPGGYVYYTADIKAKDAPKLSRGIQALMEPLSQVAAKVAAVPVHMKSDS